MQMREGRARIGAKRNASRVSTKFYEVRTEVKESEKS
jgi:hypothetical protein